MESYARVVDSSLGKKINIQLSPGNPTVLRQIRKLERGEWILMQGCSAHSFLQEDGRWMHLELQLAPNQPVTICEMIPRRDSTCMSTIGPQKKRRSANTERTYFTCTALSNLISQRFTLDLCTKPLNLL
ncbi:hypothetical protein MJO29_007161 [Puccinia striiformis f. sp. tritici]